MTVVSTALITRKLSSQPTQEDRFRALDRALARRYVSHVLREQNIALDRRVRQGSLVYKPRLELCDDPSSSRITATLELPGIKSDELRVHLDKNDVLLISGERRSRIPSDQGSDVQYLAKEIKYGRFERVLRVPKGTMMSTISASKNDGLLVVSWPRVPSGTTASNDDSTVSRS